MKQELHDTSYWINRPFDSPKDWVDHQKNWIESYAYSTQHPHRQMVVDAVKEMQPLSNLLEIGCNTGANLLRIQEVFPRIKLFGLDVSGPCIKRAKEFLPSSTFKVGNYLSIPFADKSFDAVLADASLMYASPKEIGKALEEIDRVMRWAVIIVDRFDESKKGIRSGHVWARNYPALLKDFGFKTTASKITKQFWPKSIGWQKYGYLFSAHR